MFRKVFISSLTIIIIALVFSCTETSSLAPAGNEVSSGDFSVRAEAAIAWAEDKAKEQSYEWWDGQTNTNYCLRFVANTYMQQYAEGKSGWDTAIEASQGLELYDTKENGWLNNAPRGSLIFFGITRKNPYGHVGIYLGDDKLVHAFGMVRTDVKISDVLSSDLVGDYLGWAYPPIQWAPQSPTSSNNWKLQQNSYVITGHITPRGGSDFWERTRELVGGRVGLFGGYPGFTGIEKYIDNIRSQNSILIIDSATTSLDELRLFAEKYPELLPISYEELTHYPLPLMYFSTDEQRDVVRGIIIDDMVDVSLADMLYEKGVPLGVVLEYQDGQWTIVQRSVEVWKSRESALPGSWKLQQNSYVITGHITPRGGSDFWERTRELVGGRVGLFGGYPGFTGIEKYIDNIRSQNSILIIDSATTSLDELRLFAEKYPELLPTPYEELMHYSLPLIYFDIDEQRNLVRGIIIGETVDVSLVDVLYENGIPLGITLRYQGGQFITLSP